jgi:phosphoribosylaminoimidazole-succinocarboxamide synthase
MTESMPLPHFHSGKVRDTYEIPDRPDLLLMVASDRISTHNVKHRSFVPSKGHLLNALTVFWTSHVFQGVPHHIHAFGLDIYSELPVAAYPTDLHMRGMVVRKTKPDPREFIWRNNLTGSLWGAYKVGRDEYDLGLEENLPKMHRFQPAIFTPTRKSENDEPLRSRFVRRQYPESTAHTGLLFERMTQYLHERGITLIDGKFEAAKGLIVDEWGTGDCCRFAWTKDVRTGMDPPWLDKENFRQAAIAAWNGGPKVPLEFEMSVVEEGVRKYHEAFEAITSMSLSQFQEHYLNQ